MQKTTGIVLSVSEIAQDTVLLRLSCPDLFQEAMVPGQFVHITLPGSTQHILPRPISIMAADPEQGTIDLAIQRVGKGTEMLCTLAVGTSLTLLGPLGNGFSLGKAKRVYLVGGGMGVAPIVFAAQTFLKEGADCQAFLGYRNKALAYGYALDCPVSIATNDGSLGDKAVVTQPLEAAIEKEPPDLVLACGPSPMLRSVQKICVHLGIRCQLSLEEHMACGIGACLVCNCHVRVKDGDSYKRVCVDGPVFDAREVIFDAC